MQTIDQHTSQLTKRPLPTHEQTSNQPSYQSTNQKQYEGRSTSQPKTLTGSINLKTNQPHFWIKTYRTTPASALLNTFMSCHKHSPGHSSFCAAEPRTSSWTVRRIFNNFFILSSAALLLDWFSRRFEQSFMSTPTVRGNPEREQLQFKFVMAATLSQSGQQPCHGHISQP